MPATDFTIADVLAWARTKPADEQYNFCLASVCALGQFLQTERGWTQSEIRRNDPFFQMGWAADNNIADAFQCGTFGGLVARLEKLCPAEPVPASEWTAIDAYLSEIETVAA